MPKMPKMPNCCKMRENGSKESIEESENPDDLLKERGLWDNKAQFFLSLMGYTVGIGSIWRFPVICSRNGGGAYLIPFFLFLITCGGPLYYMETCLGQFTGKSPIEAFEFAPLFRGLGYLMTILSFLCVWYINLVSVWVYYYLIASFAAVLPWSTCDNPWNTPNCRTNAQRNDSEINSTIHHNSSLMSNQLNNRSADLVRPSSPAFEFWEYKVVNQSPGLEDMGTVHTHLIGCHIFAWAFIVLAVINGVKTLGKVVYVTATIPFLFLTLMLVRGLLLDGAIDGILYYITPEFSKLAEPQVWLDAGIQVFFSLGPTWGGVITMASYNQFRGRTMAYSNMVVTSAGLTSFFNGFVVFTILGFMSRVTETPIEELAKASGPGLVFVVFPTALSELPLPQLWSVLFFLMLITVMFDSMFGMFETFTSGLVDLFPDVLIKRRALVNIATGIFYMLISIPFIMNGGIYLFDLCDRYIVHYSLLIGAFLECVAVFWIYGTDRFCQDIYLMTGRNTPSILRFLWTVFIPVAVAITLIITFTSPTSLEENKGPTYYLVLQIFKLLGLVPTITFVVVGIKSLVEMNGSFSQRFKESISPSSKWLPNDNILKKVYGEKVYRRGSFFQQLQRHICGKIQVEDAYLQENGMQLI